jgi:hypothetical protein
VLSTQQQKYINTQPALAAAPHTHHHFTLAPPQLESTQENITTKIPAQSTSDHGHLEEHQRLIKRRSRAAKKEEQEGSKESSRARSSRARPPQAQEQDQEEVEGHQIKV